ncbi:cellulose synthase family protein [Crocinitomix algicola]|uniref:cellulose synthase family protein n=1 Tax=Crocinitomix algicola TaxID=1740263 RepID=UPI00087224B2|nr:cellulose synthase family protein [Crocinitomix algicola]
MIWNSLFIIWFLLNLVLLFFVIHEFLLVIKVFTARKVSTPQKTQHKEKPTVTIQLPVYNEKYVIERLLESAISINYPTNKLQIQLLDDSTDETTEIIQNFIKKRKFNCELEHIRRPDRTGFKAGALSYGLNTAKGEFIAIFDADFIIQQNFLLETIPHFSNDKIGVVQTKWQHINEDYSLLTRAQAIMLNTHFSIEQLGRSASNAFINFNGTAGVWRKKCIEDAGGWQADTLTEDLDLSYRAQIKKWRFVYKFEVGSPAELPVTFEAFRTQQFRWSKGAAECVNKNISLLWKSTSSLKQKILGTFHLFNSSIYLLLIPLILFSPVIYYLQQNNLLSLAYNRELAIIGFITSSLLIAIFFIGNLVGQKNKLKRMLWFTPSLFVFFAMTSGISLFMIKGVIQGYFNKKSPFVRTPKFGDSDELKNKIKKGYDFKKEDRLKVFESVLMCYGLFILTFAFFEKNIVMGVYGAIITLGFALAVLFSKQTFRK